MNAAVYQDVALNWSPDDKRDWTFRSITIALLVFFALAAVAVNLIEVPKEQRTIVEVPERITKFIGERPKPAKVVAPPVKKEITQVKPIPLPEPIKTPVIEIPRAEPEKTEPSKPAKVEKRPETQRTPSSDKQRAAQEAANKQGLQTLRDGLADLLDDSSFDDVMNNSGSGTIVHSGRGDSLLAASPLADGGALSADLSGAGTGSSSGSARFVAPVNSTELVALAAADVKSQLDAPNKLTEQSSASGSSVQRTRGSGREREQEELTLMFDRNKGKLQSLYDRERRSNPGLKGKVVIELTIEPSGEVSSAKIISSELDHPKLEKRLLSRVKKFTFSARDVDTVTVIYPIEFLPS